MSDMICPNCDEPIFGSDLRYEDEPASRDYPGSFTRGCCYCLKGRYVHRYAEHEARLENEHWERRISEEREC